MRLGRTQCGLKLGPSHAAWVDLSRGWWGGSRRRHRQIELPAGLLRPSPVEPNISDPGILEQQLRTLVGGRRKKSMARRTVLVLPDLCVRATMMTLEAMPTRATELEALLRWRLEREAFFPMEGTRLACQVLDSRTVLAVVIREAVLKQYEAVCEAVGLIPVEVDVASFRLCNLFSNLVPANESVAWLTLLDDGFTLIIFQAGRPAFVRTKARLSSNTEGHFKDLAQSLTLYAEAQTQRAPRRLFLLSEEPALELAERITRDLGLEVIQPGWGDVRFAARSSLGNVHQVGVLTAAAGLIGAA